MPLYAVKQKFRVYIGEKAAEPKFRKALSKELISKFGKGRFSQEEITQIVRYCLDFYIEKFTSICKAEQSFYFYQYVLMLHEDAVEISLLHEGKSDHPEVSSKYLAVYRRILKFILETGCEVPMKAVAANREDIPRVHLLLDDLLFLGDMIFMCVTIYAEQGMIEDLGELTFDKNDLYVFSRRHHYNFIFDQILATWGHNIEKEVYDETGMQDLFEAMERCLHVRYSDTGGVIALMHKEIHFTEGVKWENLPQNLELLFQAKYTDAELFFRGLTLTKENKMSLLDLACKPNNLKRYLFRPIIVWNINGKDFAIVGPNAWTETMFQFSTNAIPWGKAPEEWMKNPCFKTFVHRKEDEHDKWLDDAVETILLEKNYYFERNATKLQTKTGYVNIDVKGLGEIDFIIVSEKVKKIFILDCKHLMGRFDAANQKNDFNSFEKGSKKTKSYNQTMQNKVSWFNTNWDLIPEHFCMKYQLDKLDLKDFTIEGIFVINTPTLYMYNADFRIYVLKEFADVLNGNYRDKEYLLHIDDKKSSKLINITYPYFKKPEFLEIDPFQEE